MLSQTCKTAVKSVIYLSCKKGKKAGINEIAEQINASVHTVGKVLQVLVKYKIINSRKGPNGGFYLTEQQQKQPIYNIVATIDGADSFRKCGLGLTECSEEYPCPIHNEYKEARQQIEKIFKNKKVDELNSSVMDGMAFLMT